MPEWRGIHWSVNVEPEVATEYAGTKLGDYFKHPEVRIATELRSHKMFHELFGYGSPELSSIGCPPIFYSCATILGSELVFPEDSSPMIEGPVIKDIEDIGKLRRFEIDDIASAGFFPYLLQDYERRKAMVGETGVAASFGVSSQSPLGTAILLRGIDLFTDIVTNPLEVKELLEIITDTAIKIIKFEERFTGNKRVSFGMDDDFGGLVSPEIYEEFNFPYMSRMYDEFGEKERWLHSETLSRGHLRLLRRMGITSYDAWPYHGLTVKDVVGELPGMFFTWNIETTRDLLSDTPGQIKEKFRQAVADGAPGMVLDLCARGVPRENIKAFIDIAKEKQV